MPLGVLSSPHKVDSVHDVTSIYRVPLLLEQQSVLRFLVKRLSIPITTPRTPHYLYKWENLADRCVRNVVIPQLFYNMGGRGLVTVMAVH